jgi:hypothetical protein
MRPRAWQTIVRRAAFVILALPAITSIAEARNQTRIGSWQFEEGDITPKAGTYFITSSTGNDREGSSSLIDFSCEGGDSYTLQMIPAPNPQTGRNDLPDGLWSVQVAINNGSPSALSGKSDGGMITAAVPRQILQTLTSTRRRSPSPDVLTAMIEKVDGGRVQRAINYPATRFRAALTILAEACRPDD